MFPSPLHKSSFNLSPPWLLPIFLIIFSALLCCANISHDASGNHLDRDALLSFYHNISSSYSSPLNWSVSIDCCFWEGVVCDKNGRVIRLLLPSRGLAGEISGSITGLSHLQQLNFAHNRLSGPLPDGLFRLLDRLETIDLSNNGLSGQLHPSDQLPRTIKKVDLADNNFEGIIQSSLLQSSLNLISLNVSKNNFTGSLPSNICNFSSSIKVLDFSVNDFNSSVPYGFGKCSRLKVLRAGFNRLTGSLPSDIYRATTLQEFSFPSNELSGTLEEGIVNLTNLKILVLYNNQLRGMIPRDIGRLSKLEQLLLLLNRLNGTLPSSLMNCTRLLTLNLRSNLLGSELSSFDFSKFSHLRTVDVGSNLFNGSFPGTLTSCRALTAIRLSSNQLTGEIPLEMQSLKSLSFLSISVNNLSNIARTMKILSSCKNLRTLILSDNFFNESLPYDESLVGSDGFENLQVLALGVCHFSGQIPIWLLKLGKLEYLDLSNNDLTGPIPSWIGNLSNLFYLSLAQNLFSGSLPIEITRIERLVTSDDKSANQLDQSYLDFPILLQPDTFSGLQYNRLSNLYPTINLRENKFQGTIPVEIGQLKFLHALDLSNNYFSGDIPDTIAELSNLEKLDLSFNSFSGKIQVSLKNLHFLSSFSVANNNLLGLIPSGGQFDTFPATSFEGNSGLCGPVLQRSCPDRQSTTTSEPPTRSTSPEEGITTFWLVFWISFGASFIVAFVTYALSCYANTSHDASGNHLDRDALLSFYHNFSSSYSSPLNWSVSIDCCFWEGVVCDKNGRVIRLLLPSRGLAGEISGSITGLSHLQQLNFAHNRLSGPLPDGLFRLLDRLETIDLSNNSLSGQLHPSDQLPRTIKKVDLADNNFEGIIQSSLLQSSLNLISLNVSKNNFRGSLPSNICNFSSSIKVLDFSVNDFNSSVPYGFGKCSRLKVLRAGFNRLTGSLPSDIYRATTLQEFSFPSNELSGTLEEGIVNLTNLKILVLYNNHLRGMIPRDIGRLSKLEQLLLLLNRLNGTLPSSLMNCTRLLTLNLRSNLLGSELSSFDFSKFSHLRTVDLGRNLFNGSFPGTLTSCRALTAIRLSSNQLTGEIPLEMQSLKSLSFLSISVNNLSNIARTMKILSSCKNLRILILSDNFFNESLPYDESLVGSDGFENLQVLALGVCHFSGQIPIWLLKLGKLEYLDLSNNDLTGPIPSWIGNLSNLFYLSLAQNLFSGSLPIEITRIERLVTSDDKSANQLDQSYLDFPILLQPDTFSGLQYNRLSNLYPTINLRENKFQGTIPVEIGQLKFLHALDLSNNYFSGDIPDTIAELSNLEKLDLSFNSFSGKIPVSLKNLHFLSSFSVANNNLLGLIPSGGQFDTFPATSFEGNSGLCGPVLQRSCPDRQSTTTSEPPTRSTSPEEGITTFWLVFWISFGASFIVAFVTYDKGYNNILRSRNLKDRRYDRDLKKRD
ncbi:hypothetical protein ACH5RR_022693 [Cinchona calisaya]|uniref:Leucine-rich repeat-containing N-terminal plant-type domain-containing protein n=1 Tax=Cinchona calisaya TaxID=153742 RepID=A0ABD2Z8I3_9GENT